MHDLLLTPRFKITFPFYKIIFFHILLLFGFRYTIREIIMNCERRFRVSFSCSLCVLFSSLFASCARLVCSFLCCRRAAVNKIFNKYSHSKNSDCSLLHCCGSWRKNENMSWREKLCSVLRWCVSLSVCVCVYYNNLIEWNGSRALWFLVFAYIFCRLLSRIQNISHLKRSRCYYVLFMGWLISGMCDAISTLSSTFFLFLFCFQFCCSPIFPCEWNK